MVLTYVRIVKSATGTVTTIRPNVNVVQEAEQQKAKEKHQSRTVVSEHEVQLYI